MPKPPGFSEAATKESGILVTAGKRDVAEGKSIYGMFHIAKQRNDTAERFEQTCILHSTTAKERAQRSYFAS